MFAQFDNLRGRYIEVGKMISDPSIVSDMKRYKQLNKEYSNISKIFSQTENITLEQYFILQKIERVKELIMYNEMTLSEIAIILNYSSVSHLSSQFKKVTGFTPSYFKELKAQKRQSIDNL